MDTEIDQRHNIVQTAIANNIPKTYHRTVASLQHSQDTQNIIAQFNALRQYAEVHGWTNEHYNLQI